VIERAVCSELASVLGAQLDLEPEAFVQRMCSFMTVTPIAPAAPLKHSTTFLAVFSLHKRRLLQRETFTEFLTLVASLASMVSMHACTKLPPLGVSVKSAEPTGIANVSSSFFHSPSLMGVSSFGELGSCFRSHGKHETGGGG